MPTEPEEAPPPNDFAQTENFAARQNRLQADGRGWTEEKPPLELFQSFSCAFNFGHRKRITPAVQLFMIQALSRVD